LIVAVSTTCSSSRKKGDWFRWIVPLKQHVQKMQSIGTEMMLYICNKKGPGSQEPPQQGLYWLHNNTQCGLQKHVGSETRSTAWLLQTYTAYRYYSDTR
jgi:hypothetical protein